MIMAVDPRIIINSPFGLGVANVIGRYTPGWLGYHIALSFADVISSRKSWKMIRATRCNQWVVHGEKLNGHALDQVVNKNYRNIATSIYELYHNINDSQAFLRLVEPNPIAIQLVQRPEYSERGLVIAGVHLGNFDMIFQMVGLASIHAIALTLPEMNAGYQKQRDMRQKKGVRVLQASVGSLKYAVDYLKAGGMVVTGIERPDPSYPYRPRFFGRPAALPIHHIFLALKAHVPVIVAAAIKRADGKYHFLFSDPIEMQPHPDRHTEIIFNAEAILQVAEGFIRQDPAQWAMTFPVWPEVLNRMPK
jgi:lauroyl/myristoyl acyltransferase